jgi:gliding motility-associated-like protein
MRSFTRYFLFLLFFAGAASLCSNTVFAQATVDLDNVKDACNGQNNGVITFTITGGVPPFRYTVIRLSDFATIANNVPVALGVPVTLTNLAASDYFLGIEDGIVTPVPPNRVENFTIEDIVAPITAPFTAVNNSSCAGPNGSITLNNPSGGSGEGFSFSWTSTNGFTSSLEDISGLTEGDYTVVVSDDSTLCSLTVGPIHIDDPSPLIQNVNPTGTRPFCAGGPASVSIDDSEPFPVVYEILRNGNPTGATANGTGNALTIVLPGGSYADGDVLTVRAVNQLCTPILMNGSVVIDVVPAPVPTITGGNAFCEGTTGVIYSTEGGQTNYAWTVSAGGTITSGGGPTNSSVTVTWNTPGAQSVSVNYQDATGCAAAAPTTLAVTVNPLPILVTPQTKSICSGDNTAYEILLNPVNSPAGTVFSWPDPDGAGPATAGTNVPMGAAGTTHINNVLTNTTTAPITVTYVVTARSGANCTGVSRNVVITVNPRPVLVTPQAKTICSGDNTAYEILLNPVNLPAGTVFNWPDPDGAGPATAGVNVPMGAAGTTHINDVLINATGVATTVTYVVTPSSGGCAGTPRNVVVTVNPRPVLVTPQTKTICNGDNVAYSILLTPANLPAGTVFNWPDPDGAGPATAGVNVPMGAAGTIHINDVLTNVTTNAITVTYVVTPTSGASCAGIPRNIDIIVSPRPVLVTPQTKTICSGDNAAYEILLNPANLPAGTTFNWPDPDGAGPATAGVNVAMGAAGTTHINDILTNTTTTPLTVTYTITPSVGGLCAGTPRTVAITVNPRPVLVTPQTKTICSGDNTAYEILLNPANLPAGTVFNWPDPDGAGPATAGVNVPMGAAGTTHINNVLTNLTTSPITVTYVVTPTSGLGCPGIPRNIDITVSPRPVLVTPQSKTICSGSNTAYEILLNPANLPAGTVFNWPDPDGAGPATAGVNVPMGAAGTTHINNVLTNVTGVPVVVTYVITPSAGTCAGTPQNVAITVNPAPSLVTPQTKTICSGDNVAYEILLSPANLPAGTVFNWPDPDGAGPATAGVNVPMGVAGTLHINDVLTNVTTAPVTVTYVVTPSTGGCAGTARNVVITVNPRPVLVTPQSKTICNGDNVAYSILLTPANLPAGTVFNWPDPDGAGPATAGVNVAMGAAGTIHINDVLTNVTTSAITVTYVVTPTSATCAGTPQNIDIIVSPRPVLVTPQTKTICSGDNAAYEILLNPANLPAGTTFNWPDPDGAGPATAGVNVPMGAAGTTHINDVLTNTTTTPLTVTYTITPSVGGTCAGTPRTVVITVNPRPVLVTPQAKTICTGDNAAYSILLTPANLPAGTVFNWPDPDGAGPATAGVNVPMGAAGTIHINDVLTNVTTTPITVTYVVTPTSGSGCPGTPRNIDITVSPRPVLVTPQTKTICSGSNTAYEILLNPANVPVGTLFNWPDPDGAGPATAGVNVPMGVAGTTHINNVLTNVTGAPIVVTYVITPSVGSCAGTPQNVAITVNPAPSLVTPQTKTICTGDNVAYEILLNPANLPAGTVFNWPDPDGAGPATAGVNVPMGVAGTIHINDVLTNVTAGPINVAYAVTPSLGGCPGTTRNVVITVNPRPILITPQSKTICSGDNVAYSILLAPASLPAGTVFNWPDPDGAGPATAGVNVPVGAVGTIHINDVLTNVATAPITVTYVVTPTSGAGCAGIPRNIDIIVSPRPVLVTPQAKTICSGDNSAYEILLNPVNLPAGTVFNWPDPDGAGPATDGVNVPMGAAGTTHINDVLTNLTTAPVNVTYVITPTAGSCAGIPQNVVITVNPRPVLVTLQSKTICSGDNVAYEILLNPANLPAGTVFNWPDPDGAGPATAGVNVPMGAAGTLHINDVLTNVAATPLTVTYVVTATSGAGCAGTPQNIDIIVTPKPVLATLQAKTICSGDNVGYEILLNPANLPAGTLFNWPDPDGAGPATAGVNVPMGVAGTIHINDVLINTTSSAATVIYVATPTIGGTCTGAPENVTITVNPNPVLVTPQNKTICSGDNVAYEILLNPANLPAGTVFNWPDPDGAGPATAGVNVPMGAAGTIHINDVLTNSTAAPITVTYVVTPSDGGLCVGTPRNIVITINNTPDAGVDNTVPACSSSTAFDLFGGLSGTPDTGGTWTDLDGSGGVITGNAVNLTAITVAGNYRFEYRVAGVAPCVDDVAVVTLNVILGPDAGLDNSATSCNTNTAFDLFLGLGGTPDGGGTWLDLDGSGAILTGNIADFTGVAVGAYRFQYTVAGTAPCGNDVAIVTVNVIDTAPDAGADNTVQACNNNTAFNLFNSLNGTPDPGGTWTDLDASGAIITGNIADLSAVVAGSAYRFQYTLAAGGGCGSSSAIVTVNVITGPDAGVDNTVQACSAETAFDLLSSLNGTPDGTGTWTDLDASGGVITGNTVNLTGVTTAGNYRFQYTVAGTAPCAADVSVVTVNVIIAPDAGIDNTAPACNIDAAFNLLNSLLGTPDGGGTWADLDGSGGVIAGNVVDLTGVAIGSYRFQYTVTGTAPCANDVSIVTVVIDNAPNAGADNVVQACSSSTAFDLFGSLNGTPDSGGTWTDLDGSGGVITSNTVDLTGVTVAGNYRFEYRVAGTGPCADDVAIVTVDVIVAPDAGIDNAVTACNTNSAFNLLLSLNGTPDGGGTWLDLDGSGAGIAGNIADFTGVAVGTYRYEYTVTGTAPCANDVSIVTVNVIDTAPDAGADNTVQACNNDAAFNLLSNLNGTPDPGGNWADLDGSGAVISGNLANLTGVAPNTYRFQYTITVVGCGTASSILTINLLDGPDAGNNATVAACNADPVFNLFAQLGGTPDGGGAWTDLDGSGGTIAGNIINLSAVSQGTYNFEYRITGTAPCVDDVAVVTVNVGDSPDAGEDNAVAECNTNAIFNLFNNLNGTPDSGGAWTDLDGSGGTIVGNIINLNSIAAGTYDFRYIVTGTAPCVNDTATVTLTVQEPPDAGTDATASACNSESAFDLLGSLGGTPDTGGSWLDVDASGAIISGNTADLTAVVAGTYDFKYIVTAAPCANDTATVTITITNGPSVANAGPDQVLCPPAFTTFLAATPVTSGTGTWVPVTPGGLVVNANSPTSQFIGASGSSYMLRWIVTSGTCPPRIDTVIINFAASPTTTSPVTACVNTGAPTLTAVAAGASSFNWYLGTGVSRTLLANTVTGSFTPSAAALDMTTVGSTSFEVTAVYPCGQSPGTPIVVNVSNTGSCGGGTGNCATVVITPVPSPATCTNSDGSINFNITPFVPVVNNEGVIINIDGISTTNQTISRTQYNDPAFLALPIGVYDYTIVYGDSSCIKTGQVTIDQSGTVGTPIASNVIDPVCAGSATGSVTLDVPGETGNVLEWSFDGGITDPFKPFTAGSQVTGIPAGPAPTFERVISVRRNSSDPCYASVRIVLQDVNSPITVTFDTDPATCNGNDGRIFNIQAGGGGGGTYQYSIDGTTFQTDDSFDDIGGGTYTLTVQDGIGCEQDFTADVTFPGFVGFSVTSTAADCSNNGTSGSFSVRFSAAGAYEAGISVDPLVEPTTYVSYTTIDPVNDVPLTFGNLSRGTYYIFAKTTSALCPTRQGPFTIDGVYALSFDILPICNDNEISIALTNITGEKPGVPFEIHIFEKFTSTPMEIIPVPEIPVTGSVTLNYDERAFLRLPDEYQIQIQQVQSDVFCLLSSPLEDYKVSQPLAAQIGSVKESYPDILTGVMNVVNFNGGEIPYEIRIELDSAAVGGQFYQTDFEEVLQNSNLQYQKEYTKIPAGRYKVEVMDEVGCVIELTGRVPLDIDIYIPNIFTPNEDGMNDLFFIRNLPAADVQLIVTNRWGKQVYSSNSYQNNWAAEDVSDGIYFYRLKISDGEPITGWVEVMRGAKP